MKVCSTRNSEHIIELHEAIIQGLSNDGGLYIPVSFPQIDMTEFSIEDTYPEFATKLLNYFFHDDFLGKHLDRICEDAFNFQVPLKQLNKNTFLLECFHGPTSSFKDFGARFLANCMQFMAKAKDNTTILVATSGDTGSAVAAAFHKKPFANVVVLFPKGKISPTQQQQIACWGDNILAVAVDGNFDDCQRLVKNAYKECKNIKLSTANSINLGRLLPQIVYSAYTSFHFYNTYQQQPGFIVPSGNLGNVTACFWAKKLGFPIREIAIACNANKVMSDYWETGNFSPRESIQTYANAMDVGNPSNFERLQKLFPQFNDFKEHVPVMSVSDKEIEATISSVYEDYGEVICPHTATAFFMRKTLSDRDWIIIATAEAAKFNSIVAPLIKIKVPHSKHLLELLEKESQVSEMRADMASLTRVLEAVSAK